MKILSIILYLILTVGGLILVKAGSGNIQIAIQDGTFNFSMGLKAMLGFIAYIGSFLIYTFAIFLLLHSFINALSILSIGDILESS